VVTVDEDPPGGDASLVVAGDPDTCRVAADELRVLSARSGHASDLFLRYSTVGLSNFLGESATAFRERCSADPGSALVARRSTDYADGLEQLSADIVEVRRGMSQVRDFAGSHGLRVVGATDVTERVLAPSGDSPARARAWAHVCALVAWQRQRERAAHARWLAVLDASAGKPVTPVPEVGPAPGFMEPEPRGPGGPGGPGGPDGQGGPDGTGGPGPEQPGSPGAGPDRPVAPVAAPVAVPSPAGDPSQGPDRPDPPGRPLAAESWIAAAWSVDSAASDLDETWALSETYPAVLGVSCRSEPT
jgi:hypothetical protein